MQPVTPCAARYLHKCDFLAIVAAAVRAGELQRNLSRSQSLPDCTSCGVVFRAVVVALGQGIPASQALNQHRGMFSPADVALVLLAERRTSLGDLPPPHPSGRSIPWTWRAAAFNELARRASLEPAEAALTPRERVDAERFET